MSVETLSRRLALLAGHGAFILFVEQVVWDGAIAGRQMYLEGKHLVAAYVLWLFIGAALAYCSLIFRARTGGVLEAVSALMLAVPLLYHVVSMSDIWG
jgi:hypothetical protein